MSSLDDSAALLSGPHLPAHLYVHVPFCASKCGYCDFASVAGAPEPLVGAVFAGVRSQLTQWASCGLDGVVDTVYFGGGTPSLHAAEVVGVMEHVRRVLVLHPRAEITVEANPDSLTEEVAQALASAGANRVSVGVQSFDDHVLAVLGRRHDAEAALRACRYVVDAGMALSVDLICGVPGQTQASWADTLTRAATTGAHHASVYPLSIEEGTPLAAAVSTGLAEEPDPDVAAEMMVLAERALGYYGLERYEVANYAESDEYRSAHNLAYWTGRAYLGVGPGAHGMLDVETAVAVGMVRGDVGDAVRVRYGNAPDIEGWLTGHGDSLELLTAEEVAREDVMLGLRLTRGVPDDQVARAGVTPVLEGLERDGLVEHTGGHWRTTQRGWLLGNEVFGRVWLG